MATAERANGLSDTPLGAVKEADYSRFETKLSPADLVLCVSDAFTESSDADGAMLGSKGLLSIVEQLDVSRPADVIPGLLERVELQRRGNLSRDDATILLFRANGTSPSMTSNLLAPWRFLCGVRDRTNII